ncbi:MAG TPA: hypothetical protein VIY47_03130 [Ignavibacteriaceae bacterium]
MAFNFTFEGEAFLDIPQTSADEGGRVKYGLLTAKKYETFSYNDNYAVVAAAYNSVLRIGALESDVEEMGLSSSHIFLNGTALKELPEVIKLFQ